MHRRIMTYIKEHDFAHDRLDLLHAGLLCMDGQGIQSCHQRLFKCRVIHSNLASDTNLLFKPSCMAPTDCNAPFSGSEGGPKLPVVSAFIRFCMRSESAHSSSGVHLLCEPLELDMAQGVH